MKLVSLSSLSETDVHAIWALIDMPQRPTEAHVAWSFEGNGIRTRATFIRSVTWNAIYRTAKSAQDS